jgi:two-component system, OmpR family, sensor histidine kinase KdpD
VGLLYPLLLFEIGQVAFGDRADGSLLRDAGGRAVGSSLIGQAFDAPQYFWGRPSAAGDGYDGGASGASNLGPTSRTLAGTVQERIDALLKANPGRAAADIPAELVTASGSGLDPHISPAGPGPRVPRRAAGERAAAQPGPRYALHPVNGRLKVFLGAAAGVGKTFAMLGEARDLRAAGVDVVIGYLEPHGRRATEARAAGLEVAPRRVARVQGRPFAEMDTGWLLERLPQLCLVDELAHTNHPGGRHPKRWQDVEELLEAGVDVFTTVNVQHLESLNDKVHELTGVRVRETFPDRLLDDADEVVLVDLPPDALRERIAQGRVYPPEKVRPALTHFFRLDNLTALRALALREVAEQEERHLLGLEPARATPGPAIGERVMVCVDGRPDSSELVRRASRMARRSGGPLYVLHVEPPDEREPDAVHQAVEAAERLGRQLGATVLRRTGDVAEAVVQAAGELAITQIVLGESHRPRWKELVGQSIIARILRETDGVDVHIIADRKGRSDDTQ